ncbi:MAG: hypothetical protein WEA99_09810 [Brumimicrobium sp.]
MKKLIISLLFIALILPNFSSQLVSNPPDDENQRKIQLAILFDTSGSMQGLLEQAKSRIWSIVNTVGTLEYDDQSPKVELALYDYGNTGNPEADGFVRQISPFTTDLDEISSLLFSLTTNGGSEFCGTVIDKSLKDLKWSQDPRDMKLIYIAGNEPFNQGDIDYKKSCENAANQEIFVSTIYCGNHDTGILEFWKNGADLGKGKYFNIDSDKKIQYIKTPYDDSIQKCNIALNATYISYGRNGERKKAQQISQDENAESIDKANMVERTMSKSSAVYSNSGWDIIDFVGDDLKKLNSIPEEELPETMKGNTDTKNMQLIYEKRKERETIQKEIKELAEKRSNYINKNSESDNQVDDFGKAISESVLKFATEKNYKQNSH